MCDELKELFNKQERERYSLRLRHKVEQDKLLIMYEQETLRCYVSHQRQTAATATATATVTVVASQQPLSFCSLIKDDEIYSQFRMCANADGTPVGGGGVAVGQLTTMSPCVSTTLTTNQQQQSADTSQSPSAPNATSGANEGEDARSSVSISEARFAGALRALKTKFEKLKEDMIRRQLNESDSLYAVQKMHYESSVRALASSHHHHPLNHVMRHFNTQQTSKPHQVQQQQQQLQQQPQAQSHHVPIVSVNNKLELVDALYQLQQLSSSSIAT